MKNSKLLSLTLCSFLTACYLPKHSAIPTAKNFERTDQQVLQAAHHWDVINKNVSAELIEAIKGKISKQDRILIKPQDSVFSQQLYYDLIATLSSAGYTVVRYDFKTNNSYVYDHLIEKNKPKHDVFIDLKTEVVKFRNDRNLQPFTGTLSKLAMGAWFLKIWDTTNWGKGTGLILANDSLDYFYRDKYFDGDPPQTEIIIDILASKNDEYVAVSKGVYYVIASDIEMYKAAKKTVEPLMREFNIIGNK